MKRLLPGAALLAVLIAVLPARAAGYESCVPWSGHGRPPRCHDRTVPVPLDAGLGAINPTVRIILPTDYNTGPKKSYPVLYLLHGAGDTYRTWTENTDVVGFSASYPVISVMPDGGCQTSSSKPWCDGAGWYSDWVDGSRKWETFHIDYLVPWVDANYRILGDGHRATAGLSMGGFGALKYAARHQGMFRAAASFSGLLDTWYGAPVTGLFYDEFSGTISDGVWGDQLPGVLTWQQNNPAYLAGAPNFKLNEVALFLTTGTGTPAEDNGNMLDIGENLIFQTNVSFVRALLTAGRAPEVHYKQDFYLGGRHAWPYWEAALHWALPQIVDVID